MSVRLVLLEDDPPEPSSETLLHCPVSRVHCPRHHLVPLLVGRAEASEGAAAPESHRVGVVPVLPARGPAVEASHHNTFS